MKRTRHPLPTTAAAALGLALLAAPEALAQRGGAAATGGDVPPPPPAAASATAAASQQHRGAAEADRMHKGNGVNGGPAELLRMAQAAMRRGQTVQANELLERAETRLLLREGAADPAARPAQGEPARHVAEARRALMNRDRAEAMRHTNLAIATARDDDSATGSDAMGGHGAQGGGRPGMVDSGMGPLPVSGRGGSVVVRDAGTSGASVSRAEGIVLAQSGNRGGGGGSALPPGDTIPGWSGLRGGAQGQTGGIGTAPGAPTRDLMPDSFSRNDGSSLNFSSPLSGPGASGITGGSPARAGGAPPGDTSRAPGSSGIGPVGPSGFGAAGPGPLR